MKPRGMALTIGTKLMLLGLGGVFVTAISLAAAAIWQGSEFSRKATEESIKLVDADLDHITQSVHNLIKAQDLSIQQKVNHDLNVAQYVLKQSGKIYLSSETVPWDTVNQHTNEVVRIDLPKMMVNERWLGQHKQMWVETPVVDLVKRLVGGACTIFQRINSKGDLLRVATNIETEAGLRDVGSYIPAVKPDGQPNPVVAKVIKGQTYRGISYAVNTWHVTAYEPIYDFDGQVIGALHVGVKNASIAALRDAIMQVKIGQSGYVFILGGKGDDRGHYIISKNGQRDGEDLWEITDADGRPFIRSIVGKAIACRPGEFATERYPWINPGEPEPRMKIARLTYYEPWDWVIGASVYEDEINQSVAIFSRGYASMIRVFGLVALVVAVIGGFIAWFFSRNMANSLGVVTQAATQLTEVDLPRLVQTMDTVNQGDLSVAFQFHTAPVQVAARDELGTLAKAFTSMNLALVNVGTAFTTMVANLRHLTGQLEGRVAERTAELEDSKRRLSHIIDFLPDATLVIDKKSRVISWNRAMEKFTGIPCKEMLGKGDYEYAMPFYGERRPLLIDLVLHPDRDFERKYGAFNRDGDTLYGESQSNCIKDEAVNIFASASALYDSKGEVVGAIESLRDITAWKRAEQELIQARHTAEEATMARGEFLANMSHEIRTPMNGVIGMIGLLLDSDLSREQCEYAQTVQSSADALLTVINDILDFSKIESGKLDFETIDFDLRLTLDEIADLVSIKAEEKKIEFASYVHPQIPSLLRGDPGRLRQVLLNLTTNAIKFTDAGEVVVEVVMLKEDDRAVDLKFEVRDTGIGIPKDRLNRLFKSFSQVDSSTTRKFGGTGLGLAISKRLVEMMDGQIGVDSKAGAGSAFWFTARIKKQSPAKTNAQERRMPTDIQGKRLLAVDDNETNRRIMRAYLRTWNCHATVVESGQQAMALLTLAADNDTPFDMAIIDFMMPEMDGVALGQSIKAHPALAQTRLMLLTSRGIRGDAARARRAGFDAYLTKPIKQSQLFNAIVSVFGNAADDTGAAAKALITRHSLAETQKRKLSILLTEDNLVNQKVALIHLKKFGYTADLANNGREAVEALKENRYDLILMDVQMPVMDGYDATRAIRDAGHDLPIIAMTANAMKGDREKCLEAGMEDYITKPVNPQLLLETIKKWTTQAPAPPSGADQRESRA